MDYIEPFLNTKEKDGVIQNLEKKKKLAKEKYYATLRFSLLPATKRKSKK